MELEISAPEMQFRSNARSDSSIPNIYKLNGIFLHLLADILNRTLLAVVFKDLPWLSFISPDAEFPVHARPCTFISIQSIEQQAFAAGLVAYYNYLTNVS